LALEGGYAVSALANSVKEVLKALTGSGYAGPVPGEKSPRSEELVAKAMRAHRKYGVWAE
jgi:hypothetical protein